MCIGVIHYVGPDPDDTLDTQMSNDQGFFKLSGMYFPYTVIQEGDQERLVN